MTYFTFHRFKVCFIYAAVIMAAVLSVVSCTDESLYDDNGMYFTRPVFDVQVNSSWTKGNVTTRGENTHINIEKIEDCGYEQQLYLVTELEKLEGYSVPLEKKLKTRGTSVTGTTFPESFGLFAICHDGEEAAENFTGSLYAKNVEVKKQGNLWQAVGNELNWVGTGRMLFNAYAPYTSGTSGISYTEAGMPCLKFTVNKTVKDQTDLLTSKADTPGSQRGAVSLDFSHALSAITICTSGDAMLAGEISKVTISGIYGSGKLELNTGKWTLSGRSDATYSAETEVKLEDKGNHSPYYTGEKLYIAGEENDLTFFMIPQALGADAKLSLLFTDKLSGTERTLSASIGGDGKEWKPGQLYTYSISSTGVVITPVLEITKDDDEETPLFGDNGYYQTIPFSGAMRDLKMRSYVKVFQYDEDKKETNKKEVDVPVNVYSSVDGGEWTLGAWEPDERPDSESASATAFKRGSLAVQAQPLFHDNDNEFNGKYSSAALQGLYSSPTDLSSTYNHPSGNTNETANCYMVSNPGYFTFPAVYGNALKNGENNTSAYTINRTTPTVGTVDNAKGLKYFVNHNNQQITTAYIADQPGAGNIKDAILLWSDSPGLVDMVEYKDKKIQFRIAKNTIADGNAVIALRNTENQILWSWHIWVTKVDHCSTHIATKAKNNDGSENSTKYKLMNSMLGYSPAHKGTSSRRIKMKFEFDLKDVSGNKLAISSVYGVPLEFTQDAIIASLAGDNTYYQWGRKDAMLPGVYDKADHAYYTYVANNMSLTMLNKPIYDQYKGYEFRSSVKEGRTNGMNIGETIQYPYVFIMGENITDSDAHFRKHWHSTGLHSYIEDNASQYTIYNAWNSTAYHHGGANIADNGIYNNQPVTKTVYDPCPPGFNVPNSNAFAGMGKPGAYGTFHDGVTWDATSRNWTVPSGYGETEKISNVIHATGVRDICINNFKGSLDAALEKATWPAFCMLTFITSTTLGYVADDGGNGEVLIFYIDNRKMEANGTNIQCGFSVISNGAYGLTVWPEFSGTQQSATN